MKSAKWDEARQRALLLHYLGQEGRRRYRVAEAAAVPAAVPAAEPQDAPLPGDTGTGTDSGTDSRVQFNVRLDGNWVTMLVDTGAAVSIIPRQLYETALSHRPLLPTTVNLRAYGGSQLVVTGVITASVETEDGRSCQGRLYVVDGGTPLLGRDLQKSLCISTWHGSTVYEVDRQPGRSMEHVKGRINPADGLSRLPSSVQEASDDEQLVIAALTEERAAVTGAELRAASQSDPVLSKLRQQIPRQWPRRYAEIDDRRGEPAQPDGAADRTGPTDAELESSGDRDRLEQQEQDRLEAIPEPETTDTAPALSQEMESGNETTELAWSTPGQTRSTPGQAWSTPGQAWSTPGQTRSTPGQAWSTPGEGAWRSGPGCLRAEYG
ncbi:hypothetical protein FJT64_009045 [Amphibalanus amphitrite]|uniref:Peptidase A2 domain-containing protein n=1 Tax=Amphibalanus amphitrite TaxID=1232801 RepID=A0A6A4VNB4_AMPAM|nr:hypothetical protein FJT64_009045 [Amphibalanus amphitrite]